MKHAPAEMQTETASARPCCWLLHSVYFTRRHSAPRRRSHLPSTEYLVTVIQCFCEDEQRRTGDGALGFPLQPFDSGVVSQMAHRMPAAPIHTAKSLCQPLSVSSATYKAYNVCVSRRHWHIAVRHIAYIKAVRRELQIPQTPTLCCWSHTS